MTVPEMPYILIFHAQMVVGLKNFKIKSYIPSLFQHPVSPYCGDNSPQQDALSP
jgi:hypothetical protein